MGLELYMVGVIVEDMPRAVEFYRRLGVEIPDGSENQLHVSIRMSGKPGFHSAASRSRIAPEELRFLRVGVTGSSARSDLARRSLR